MKMDLDPSKMATADVVEMERLSTALGEAMMHRLRRDHPLARLRLFFPVALNGVPDCDFVRTYGEDVLYDVLEATDTVFRAIGAREELQFRRYPT
jgi:hypothetical protein